MPKESDPMTPEEKQAACLRICGPNVRPEFHRTAPEMCPIAWDYWRNPKLRAELQDAPKFKGVNGPMWGGDATPLNYEYNRKRLHDE